jgi:hypothetical protein
VISVEENRTLETFNDPASNWDWYFEECGRTVALGEKTELTEALVNAAGAPIVQLDRADHRFVVLDRLIRELVDGGIPPKTLLAPVSDLPEFHRHFQGRISWPRAGGTELSVAAGMPLRLIWSSKSAPLEDYVLLRHEVGAWHVVPDPDNGKALSVAVGVHGMYDDTVKIIVQTMAKFELLHPEQLRIMRVPSAAT